MDTYCGHHHHHLHGDGHHRVHHDDGHHHVHLMMVMKEMQYPQVHILYRSGVPWDCLKYLLFLQSSSLSSLRACGGPGNGENMTQRGHLGTTSRPQVEHN